MSFLTPLALGLGILAGPIVLMYMLRLRRREVQVSSTMLWQQILRDREANAPWQKLKRNLLLLLQLLILAALVIALARPFVAVPTVTTGRIAILVDASASMNATDVQPSRFEAAKEQANGIVNTLGPQDSVAVIRVADQPEVAANYTGDASVLHDAINSLQVSQASADWNAALTLAAAGASGAEKFTIVVIGDGGVSGDLASTYGDVQFIQVGKSDANLAISALAVDHDPTSGPEIYGRVSNYGSQPADVVFSVKLDDKLFSANTYNVAANGSTSVVVTKLPNNFHQVEASLIRPAASTVPDYLALDDTAYAIYNPVQAGRALLMTKQNRFLQQGFASIPDWQLFEGDISKPMPTNPYDLYIFDGWLPPTLPNANTLIVNPPSDTPLFKVGAESTATTNVTVKPDDPLTRFLKFSDVNIKQFEPLTGADWADPIVSADGGPLVLAGEYNNARVAVISFDLHDSDLPLNIAWPILLSNLTDWYKAPRAVEVNGSLQPGQALTIQPGLDSDTVRVQRPDGATTTLKVDSPQLVYADTSLPGIYKVDLYSGQNQIREEQFAVNLFDANESNITPRTPTLGGASTNVARKDEIGQREFWPWIALAALLILMIEWYIHHRRLQIPRLSGALSLRRFARKS